MAGTPRSTAHRFQVGDEGSSHALTLAVARDGEAGDFDAVAVEHAVAVEGVQPSNDPLLVGGNQHDMGCWKCRQPLAYVIDTDVITQLGGQLRDGRRVG